MRHQLEHIEGLASLITDLMKLLKNGFCKLSNSGFGHDFRNW